MKKCKKNKKKWLKPLVITILIVLSINCYFTFYVNPIIVETNKANIKATTIQVVNSAISKVLKQNNYNDFVSISKDADGRVNLISVNNVLINQLNTFIIDQIQKSLSNNNLMHFDVALGTFTGIPLLNGVGANISLKITPIGTVNTNFISHFTSTGINQSLHKIYIDISTTVCAVLPLYTQNIEINNKVLVAESVIVGEIPSVYLNSTNLNGALNLVPW